LRTEIAGIAGITGLAGLSEPEGTAGPAGTAAGWNCFEMKPELLLLQLRWKDPAVIELLPLLLPRLSD